MAEYFRNTFLKAYSGGQKLVVPDGDIPAKVVFVDEAHQLPGMGSVLFAVAEEDVGIKIAVIGENFSCVYSSNNKLLKGDR